MELLARRLLHISVPLFIIHAIEEFYFNFYTLDSSTISLARLINLDTQTTFLLIQMALFVFLGALLILVLLNKNILWGSFFLGLILLFESSHIIGAVGSHAYHPGIITGILLFGVGIWYWVKAWNLRYW